MTAKKTDKTTVDSQNGASNGTDDAAFVMPGDYKVVNPVGNDQKWWKVETGGVVFGRIVGRFERKNSNNDDKRSFFYQIQLEKYPHGKLPPVRYIQGKGDDAVTKVAEVGDIINMDERSAIANLAPLAKSDGVFNAIIHCLGKQNISGGRTYWDMDVRTKQVKAPSTPIVMSESQAQTQTDDMGAAL